MDTIGNVFLIAFGVGFAAVVVVLAGSLVAAGVFKVRRLHRIVASVGRDYDSDGLRIKRDPDHGSYYVRRGAVLKALPEFGTAWLSGDSKWCVAYEGSSDRLWVTRRSRELRRSPLWARKVEGLEDLRPTMRAIDRREFPWHDAERRQRERESHETKATCEVCGRRFSENGLRQHQKAKHGLDEDQGGTGD
mgnify:CR=1 FL=1